MMAQAKDEGVIRCVCGYTTDDGFTIQCDRCLVWQHAVCLSIKKDAVPEEYLCDLCNPRPIDFTYAREVQRRKRLSKKAKRKPPRKRQKRSASVEQSIGTASDQDDGHNNEDFFDSVEEFIPVSRNIVIGEEWLPECEINVKEWRKGVVQSTMTLRAYKATMFLADCAIEKGAAIAELRGEVYFQNTFTQDVDARFVFCLPECVVDCRRFANEARFVRFSCKPNARLAVGRSLEEQDDQLQQYRFKCILVADQNIEDGNEITVPYSGKLSGMDVCMDCACESEESCMFNPKPHERQPSLEINGPPKQNDEQLPSFFDSELFSKATKDLTREERKLKEEMIRFAKMEKVPIPKTLKPTKPQQINTAKKRAASPIISSSPSPMLSRTASPMMANHTGSGYFSPKKNSFCLKKALLRSYRQSNSESTSRAASPDTTTSQLLSSNGSITSLSVKASASNQDLTSVTEEPVRTLPEFKPAPIQAITLKNQVADLVIPVDQIDGPSHTEPMDVEPLEQPVVVNKVIDVPTEAQPKKMSLSDYKKKRMRVSLESADASESNTPVLEKAQIPENTNPIVE